MAELAESLYDNPAQDQGLRNAEGIKHTNDPIERVLTDIAAINARKRADYAAVNDIFSNFKESASFAGLRSPGQAVEALIGTKDARLRQLLWHRDPGLKPNNESIEDTLLDRAVYSVIALAMYREGLYD